MEWVASRWFSGGSREISLTVPGCKFQLNIVDMQARYEMEDVWHWSVCELVPGSMSTAAGWGFDGDSEQQPMTYAEAERRCLEAFISLCTERQREYRRLAKEANVLLETGDIIEPVGG